MKNEMTDAEMLAEALRALIAERIPRYQCEEILATYESRKAVLKPDYFCQVCGWVYAHSPNCTVPEPPCPTCKGTGEISVDLGGPTFADEDCPDCSGDKP